MQNYSSQQDSVNERRERENHPFVKSITKKMQEIKDEFWVNFFLDNRYPIVYIDICVQKNSLTDERR